MKPVGYVKFWRKAIEDESFSKDHTTFRVWMELLALATHRPYLKTIKVGNEILSVELQAGECVITLRPLALKLGITLKRLRTSLNRLKQAQRLAQQTTHRYTKITIINWDSYQSSEQSEETATDTGIGKPWAQQGHSLYNNKNNKNNKNSNKKDIYTQKKSASEKSTRKKRETISYGEFENVQLTPIEFERLKTKFGETLRDKCIQKLDWHIERKEYKSKNHNLCIQDWVIKAVMEAENNTKQNISYMTAQEKRDYALQNSLNDIYSEIDRIQHEKIKLIGDVENGQKPIS